MLIGEIGNNASFDLSGLGKNFAAAREFLLSGGCASLPVGNHAIVGDDVFVMMQEYTQQKAQGVPQYRVVAVTGPAHAPQYEVEVLIKDKVIARGAASSHKLAEREAARAAVHILLHHDGEKAGTGEKE